MLKRMVLEVMFFKRVVLKMGCVIEGWFEILKKGPRGAGGRGNGWHSHISRASLLKNERPGKAKQ